MGFGKDISQEALSDVKANESRLFIDVFSEKVI